jgi:hypothetical protein
VRRLALTPLLALSLALNACADGPIPVSVEQDGERFQLVRDGEPYEIRGAGIEFGDKAEFAARGGNSFRTWRTDNGVQIGQEVLDEALALGLTVVMCIEVIPERKGFDYDDEAAVQAQLDYARGEVMKYKDHPALLAWMIGNEPNLFFENPKVFDAINDIASMIDELDPNHPTTTAIAGYSGKLAKIIETRAPALDFLSIQMYGDIVNLPRYIKETGFEKPFMVTEWGAIGHWEVGKTAWDAPIEQNSTAKAENYRRSHEITIASNPNQIIGNYVFLWGQKQERTPTWYGMFLEDGSSTAATDTMQYLWTGEWPVNRAPHIDDIVLDGRGPADSVTLAPGQSVTATVDSSDPEGGELNWRWALMEESRATEAGGDKEKVPSEIPGRITGGGGEVTLVAPETPGAYRLFVYTDDGAGNAAHANIPFLVKN